MNDDIPGLENPIERHIYRQRAFIFHDTIRENELIIHHTKASHFSTYPFFTHCPASTSCFDCPRADCDYDPQNKHFQKRKPF